MRYGIEKWQLLNTNSQQRNIINKEHISYLRKTLRMKKSEENKQYITNRNRIQTELK